MKQQVNTGSCASILRIIPISRKSRKMPPFHHAVRGHHDDTRPAILQAVTGDTGIAK
jgi:hypothetical protein